MSFGWWFSGFLSGFGGGASFTILAVHFLS